MQGVVMVAGVLILLPLSISAVGGLEKGTRDLAKMTPPRLVYLDLELDDNFGVQKGDWIRSHDQAGNPQVFRIAETRSIDSDRPKENKQTIAMVDAIQITSPHEVERILRDEKLFKNGVRITRLPPSNSLRGSGQLNLSSEYYQGVAAGTAFWLPRESVLAKFRLVDPWQPTAYGAYSVQPMRFEVSTPRDEPLPSQDELRNAFRTLSGRKAAVEMSAIQFASTGGPDNPGVYVTGPGPSYSSSSGFLPFSLAISFFFMWCMGGAGQPNFMVRLMAFNNSKTLRNGIVTVTIYYSLIYFPLVIIFCCARVLLPGMEIESDRIMPAMALHLTERAGMAWLAGLLIAAPFAAVMSTVDSFLLVISSSVVRDIYQRNINPDASEKTMKRIAYGCTLVVGIIAMLGAVNPPQFLQDIIVYVGSGLAACFLAPMVFGLYWPRINSAGAIAAMLGGFGTHIAMYLLGMFLNGSFFNPFKIFGFDPTVVGLIGSFACGYVVTKMTAEPPEDLVQKYFCKPVAND
ncbi:MAG: hypothetical protein AB8G99_25195, partial [Planctomycetaceae bacterium]